MACKSCPYNRDRLVVGDDGLIKSDYKHLNRFILIRCGYNGTILKA